MKAGSKPFLVLWLMMTVSMAGGTPALAQEASEQKPVSYTIPFRSLWKNDLLIPVALNGKQFWFLLDTGTALDVVLDVWAARLLHLAQKPLASPLAGGDYQGASGALQSLKLPFEPTARTNVPVTIAHLSDHSPEEQGEVAGIIGVPFLEGRSLTIDYLHKMLTITDSPSVPVVDAATTALPMPWLPGGYSIRVTTEKGESAFLCVDTGSVVTTVPQSLIPGGAFRGVQSSLYTKADSTEVLTWSVLLSRLSLGTQSESNVPVSFAAPGETLLLGQDVLCRFLVTLDFQNHLMLLRRAEDYKERCVPDAWIHVITAKRHGRVYVERIERGFESRYPQLHTGDRILKVAGRSIDAAFIDREDHFAPGAEGSKVVLRVQHGRAKPRTVICSRQTGYLPLSRSRQGLFGYILKKRFHQPITVEDYLGDPEDQQIPQGSALLSIEGISVKPYSLPLLESALLLPKIRIHMIKPSGASARIRMK